MRESPIQVTLTIHLVLSIDPTEQYPLAAVAEFLTEQNIESTLLESLIERLNEVNDQDNFCKCPRFAVHSNILLSA